MVIVSVLKIVWKISWSLQINSETIELSFDFSNEIIQDSFYEYVVVSILGFLFVTNYSPFLS